MFLLGAMVMYGYEPLAIGLGVVTAAVLAYKQPLHGFVEKLGWDDVYAGMRLLIATFIALPLLPNEPIDPWGALNPYKSVAAGDPDFEPVAGRLCADAPAWSQPRRCPDRLVGGLASSTAVTLSFAKEGRETTHRCQCARLRHSSRLGRNVRARAVLVAVVNRPLLRLCWSRSSPWRSRSAPSPRFYYYP